MRAKVAELLEENNRLPEAERMDVHEFELDVEEQQRRGTIWICILKLLFTYSPWGPQGTSKIMLDGCWAFFLCFRSFFCPCFRYLICS